MVAIWNEVNLIFLVAWKNQYDYIEKVYYLTEMVRWES